MTTRLIHRPARGVPSVDPAAEHDIERPPVVAPGGAGFGSLLTLLPMLGAGTSMTVMMLFRGSSLAALGALMMVLTIIASAVLIFGQRGKAARQRREQRDRYLAYLERERAALSEAEDQRAQAARLSDVHPDALLSVARSPQRLWDRRRDDDDFLRVRVGLGQVPATRFARQGDDNPLQESDDLMNAELDLVERRFATARDLPVRVPLDRAGEISIVGDADFTRAVARLLVAQATTTSSPEDVQLALVTAPETLAAHWSWATWLPHLADQDRVVRSGPVRRIAPSMDALHHALRHDLHRRLSSAAEARRGHGVASATRHPRLLVIVDGHGSPARSLHVGDPDIGPGDLGITVIHLLASRDDEPTDVRCRLSQGPLDAATAATATTATATGVGGDEVVIEQYARRDTAPTRHTARIDAFTTAQAEALARHLAAVRLSPDSLEHDAGREAVAATRLMGIDDIEAVDLDTAWAPRARASFLRVPIGTDDNGDPVMLDLKESAQFGMGPHGLCVGATGSGKSELLRTLVLGLLATHGPADVQLVLVDYKGGATFAPFADAPQVSGVITNLSDDANLVERVYASLSGEVQRRQQVLKDAGNLPDITSYRRRRAERLKVGEEMAPLPHLLVIIDEFGELLTARPDFIELFLSIGRIGRSIGVHLLLSSQRIEGGKLRGLDTYLSYRIGLRTLSDAESRTVLDTPDAFALPPLPGYGFLKVDTTTYTRFRAGYVSGPLPEPVDPAAELASAAPVIERIEHYPPIEGEIEDAGTGGVSDDDLGADEPDPDAATVLSTVVGQLAVAPRTGSPVWLPPMPDAVSLDQVGGRPRPTRSGLRMARTGPLRTPMGLVDDPRRQRQDVWELDLAAAGGNVLVVGAPRSGRTTVLRTLAASLALTHAPSDVVVYGMDLLASNLLPLVELPNVGGVAVRMEPEVVRRTVEEIMVILREREDLFQRHRIDSLASARASDDDELKRAMLADVVLLVDGFGQITEEFEVIEESMKTLVRRGGAYGIHVVGTVARWNEVRLAQQTFFGTVLELRLADPGESGVGRTLSQTLTASRPGRGLLASELFVQVALPRVDGRVDAASAASAWHSMAHEISGATGQRAPRVRLLPAIVEPEALAPGARVGLVPIGLDEADLATTYLDLDGADRNVVLIGDPETGRTSMLRQLATSLMEQYTSEELVFAVYDPRRTLSGFIPDDYLGGYASSPVLAQRLTAALLPELQKRVPSSVEGQESALVHLPRIVVLADDYDVLTAGSQAPLEALVPLVAMSREVNLNVVLARRTAGASRGVYERLFVAARDAGATGLMFSGDRSEGMLLGTVRPQSLPPGRAQLVRMGQPPRTVQTVLRRGDDEEALTGVGFAGR